MTRLLKIPTKIPFLFCTLFCLYSPLVFSQQVDTAWVRRYNGPGNGDDKAVALAVDSGGNVYVTGSSFDSATGYDFCTIKYLPNGDTAWIRRHDGPAHRDDFPYAMTLDKNRNVYVTGNSYIYYNPGPMPSYFSGIATIKYDPQGNLLWVSGLSCGFGFETCNGVGHAITVDDRENVYVTGWYFDLFSSFWITIKNDSAGNVDWIANEGNPNPGLPFGIAADNEGNVFATHIDSTIKYDSAGNQVWARGFLGTTRGIAMDNNGRTYVVGADDSNFTVIKYDASGDSLWVRRSNSRSEEWQSASFVAADEQNNIYVVGDYASVPDDVAWTALKYDSVGNRLWYRAYRGINFGQSREPKAMVLDTTGNLYVTGYDAWFAATLKYDPQGNLQWEKKYGDANHPAELRGVGVDQKENTYVTGFTQTDFLTIKYAPLPQLKGDLNLDGVLGLQDVVYAVNYTFAGEPPPAAPSACDINCDGKITPADVVILLNMIFASVSAPC